MRSVLGFLILVLVYFSLKINAQVLSDNNAQTQQGVSVSSLTITDFQTPDVVDGLLLVYTHNNVFNNSVTDVTYNSQNLIRAIYDSDDGSTSTLTEAEIWYLLLGTNTSITSDVVVTFSGTADLATIAASTYQNVDQTTPIGATDDTTGAGGGATCMLAGDCPGLTLSTSNGNMVVDALTTTNHGSAPVPIDDEGQELYNVHNDGPNDFNAAASIEEATGNSTTVLWVSGGIWSIVAAVLNQASGPLAIELDYFKGRLINGGVVLSWQAYTDTANSGFYVEHSQNAISWHTLDFITGHASELGMHEYSYLHHYPPSGNNYYRLKQANRDSSFEYSNVLTFNISQGMIHNDLDIFPNPVYKDKMTVHVPSVQAGGTRIRLYDSLGKLVMERSMTETQMILELDFLPEGLYFLQAGQGQIYGSKKILIVHH